MAPHYTLLIGVLWLTAGGCASTAAGGPTADAASQPAPDPEALAHAHPAARRLLAAAEAKRRQAQRCSADGRHAEAERKQAEAAVDAELAHAIMLSTKSRAQLVELQRKHPAMADALAKAEAEVSR